MGIYVVTATISGTAYAMVEASNEDEALEKAKVSGDWKIDDWDLSTEPHRGGYISVEEE